MSAPASDPKHTAPWFPELKTGLEVSVRMYEILRIFVVAVLKKSEGGSIDRNTLLDYFVFELQQVGTPLVKAVQITGYVALLAKTLGLVQDAAGWLWVPLEYRELVQGWMMAEGGN